MDNTSITEQEFGNIDQAIMEILRDNREVFAEIVEQAWAITDTSHAAFLALNLNGRLQIVDAHLSEALPFKQVLPFEIIDSHSTKIGISGRALVTGKAQLVGDTNLDHDYISFDQNVNSELAVPIKTRQGVVGVLDVQHTCKNASSEKNQEMLMVLASYVAVIIEKSQQYQELKDANEKLQEMSSRVAARTALAWLGVEKTSWRHKIVGHIGAIENYVKLIERSIESEAPKDKILDYISRIKQVIAKTRENKIAESLPTDKGRKHIIVDEFISTWSRGIYLRDLELDYQEILSSNGACIWVNPQWLKLALDNIVDNAVQAMEDAPVRRLLIKTYKNDKKIQITISDTGSGIPDEILPMMFKEIIQKEEGTRSEGIGQLLAATIVETYGGSIEVLSTGTSGTSIAIWIPLA